MWITAVGATEEVAAGRTGFRIAGWPVALPLSGPIAPDRSEIAAEVVYVDATLQLRLL